ncbi:MAG: hypothetical protein J5629_08785 [Muribaculaceae bacterium]|nr:hypothetical protein [Muribaculaceae bacterium]
MQITYQYYYRKGKVTAKAVIYTILSVLLVAFAVFCYIHWEMSFLFSEWQGYVIIVVYGLITLGMTLSIFENIKKVSKTNRGIPAFAVGERHFVIYDNTGMANVIPFEECDKVRFKRTYSRITGTRLALIIKYHDKMETSSTVEIDLSELDSPQEEIEKQLKKIYKNQASNELET